MRGALLSAVFLVGISVVISLPYPQKPVPPHLLRQYLAHQQQERARQSEPTPIYESDSQETPQPQFNQQPGQQYVQQYVPQPQQQYVAQPQQQYVAQPQQQYVSQVQQEYRPKVQAQRPRPKPVAQRLQQSIEEEEPADYDPNPSYQFGFDVNDDQYTNYQNRKEERQGDVIKGSYSVVDSDGFIRTVTYTADPKEGFKAEVVRKPTDIVVKIPTPAPTEAPHRLQPAQYHDSSRHPQPQQYVDPSSQSRPQQQQYYRYQ